MDRRSEKSAPTHTGPVDTDPSLRLAPHAVLLRRSATELQVGVEPSVVVPATYAPVVRSLAAGADGAELERAARDHGLPAHAVPDLLGALHDAHLLRPTADSPTRTVRVVGAGPLGSRVAHELVLAGFRAVYLADLPGRAAASGRRGRSRARTDDRPDRLDLLTAALAGLRPDVRVRRTRHFVKPEGAAVALTVVVADGPEPDRLVPDLLREHSAAHLLVRSHGDDASVGPLVVPGETSCVRCADLARRDADPRWPWLLAQLVRLTVEPTPTLLAWAAVTATVQALAFCDGGSPETLGHTLELGADAHRMRLRPWPVHPECPCRWQDADAPG